jgi:hypothetical protein
MFAVFLLWVPALFYIASRFTGTAAAALVTLLCVIWSVPTYPAAMPSWYNLFFATFGIAALFRFTETDRAEWLFAAGWAGGLSVLIKMVGLYYIAAALLFFVWDERRGRDAQDAGVPNALRARGYAVFVSTGLGLFVLMLWRLVRGLPGHARYLHFVLPGALFAALLAATVWRDRDAVPSSARVRRLGGYVAPFVLGTSLPVLWFLVPYARSGAVDLLARGVFVEPMKRATFAAAAPIPLWTIWAAAGWLIVLMPGWPRVAHFRWPRSAVAGGLMAIGGILGLVGLLGGRPYADAWFTVKYVAPLTVVAGSVLLAGGAPGADARRRSQIWLLLCAVAMCSLIQVPYAGYQYVFYFAPLAILALLAIITSRRSGIGAFAALGAGFFSVFGIACVNPGYMNTSGEYSPRVNWPTTMLTIPRTGPRTGPKAADAYARVVQLLRSHSGPDGYTYAAPDCPEVYYLAELRDPTRTLFDFFEPPAGHTTRVLQMIDSLGIQAIAQNTTPLFSPRMDPVLVAGLRARLPDSAVVGNFIVQWSGRAPTGA